MLNRAVIVGRLTRDPDLRYTPNGVAVANFTVAANRPFKNQQGEQEADFINCVAWRNQAENLANYMKKGSLIGVDGRIQTRSYDNKDGNRVFVTEVLTENIQFLEPRSKNEERTNNQGSSNQYDNRANTMSQQYDNTPQSNDVAQGTPIDISDDDLPL